MGALQPGMPSPNMLPAGWHILIVDLKDCFFTIPLHPRDTQRFAFSARQAHETFHQNAKGLWRQYGLSDSEARSITQACPKCGNHGPGIG
ncbi:Endogenous retrovirus group K member 18 Pol protein, partial [Eudyptula minor]